MSEFSLVPALKISASGLDAEQFRMEVIANNVANAHTVRGEDGRLYQRKEVVFATRLQRALKPQNRRSGWGVEVKDVVEDARPPKQVYRPGHPYADAQGFIEMPDIHPVEEMVDMMTASRAYEANLAAIKIARNMADRAISLGQ